MIRVSVWTLQLRKPVEPTSVRLAMPWLVLIGTPCPQCGIPTDRIGAVTHSCGERLEVTSSGMALMLLVQYPAGYVVVRSDQWDHYLVKPLNGLPILGVDSRVPLSTVHAAPWVIWNGEGEPRSNWGKADQCPECGKPHSGNHLGLVFRCECKARLLPLPAETIVGFTEEEVVDNLWDEQALILKSAGVHLLFSVLTFPPNP